MRADLAQRIKVAAPTYGCVHRTAGSGLRINTGRPAQYFRRYAPGLHTRLGERQLAARPAQQRHTFAQIDIVALHVKSAGHFHRFDTL